MKITFIGGGNMAQGSFAPSFELAMARKDLGLMLATAGARPLAVLPGVAARMDQLIAAGHSLHPPHDGKKPLSASDVKQVLYRGGPTERALIDGLKSIISKALPEKGAA